jgi:hypothetical protein
MISPGSPWRVPFAAGRADAEVPAEVFPGPELP